LGYLNRQRVNKDVITNSIDQEGHEETEPNSMEKTVCQYGEKKEESAVLTMDRPIMLDIPHIPSR
jgi:hypothetical protein